MLTPPHHEHAWLHRLQERGEFHRCIVETTFEGVWVVDGAARTAFANDAMANLLGTTVSAMFGRQLFDFMDEEGRLICTENLARRRQGTREQHEVKLRHQAGHAVWVLMSTNPLHDERGQYAGALAMVNDITERKLAELELKRVNEELEQRVAARTRELTDLNRRLAELAAHDPLTGLLNRRALDERLGQEVASATRYGVAFSLLLLDVDHFKGVNDTAGHAAGDVALRTIAELLTEHVRQTDIAARFGGDEFVVLAPHTPRSGALILAERLRRAVETSSGGPSSGSTNLTVSIGAAVLGERTSSPAALLDQADAAMYSAKREGRNRVCG